MYPAKVFYSIVCCVALLYSCNTMKRSKTASSLQISTQSSQQQDSGHVKASTTTLHETEKNKYTRKTITLYDTTRNNYNINEAPRPIKITVDESGNYERIFEQQQQQYDSLFSKMLKLAAMQQQTKELSKAKETKRLPVALIAAGAVLFILIIIIAVMYFKLKSLTQIPLIKTALAKTILQ